MCTKYVTIINDISVYSVCIKFSWNFLKKCKSRKGKNNIFHRKKLQIHKYKKLYR